MLKSKFSNIKGIGKKYTQNIWKEFNTLEELKHTPVDEISKKLKISINIAKKIKSKA